MGGVIRVCKKALKHTHSLDRLTGKLQHRVVVYLNE